jgi:hypothetical protein
MITRPGVAPYGMKLRFHRARTLSNRGLMPFQQAPSGRAAMLTLLVVLV